MTYPDLDLLEIEILEFAIKHGKHDQRSHGRRTARRRAYSAAYTQARAGGATPAEARAKAKAAGLERQAERDERLQKIKNLKPGKRDGDETRAYGADPTTQYTMQHRLVDMADIKASNTANGGINPEYDARLQPRDRSRSASQAQIDEVARNLKPDVLVTDFHRIDSGSPVIDANGNVLSGNGRTLALQRAADMHPAQYQAYKDRVKEEAARLGIDPREVDRMQNPVLVRELKGDADPVAFAREANTSGTLRMSPLEQAKVDAGQLSNRTLSTFSVREGQDIDRALRDPANRPFVNDFLKNVPDNERANLLTRDGSLNQMGLYRMKAAIYTRVFDSEAGSRMAESMLESLDTDVKTIQNGISGALPGISRAKGLFGSNQRDRDLDITEDFAKAVDALARIKENPAITSGVPASQWVSKYLGQSSMFERELNPRQERLLSYVDRISRKPTAVRDMLNRWAKLVEDQPPPGQTSLFGGDRLTRDRLFDLLLSDEGPGEARTIGLFE